MSQSPQVQLWERYGMLAYQLENVQEEGVREAAAIEAETGEQLSRPRPSTGEEDVTNTSTQPGEMAPNIKQMKTMLELSIHRCIYL